REVAGALQAVVDGAAKATPTTRGGDGAAAVPGESFAPFRPTAPASAANGNGHGGDTGSYLG
ncbi:hypothetical protein, partial [Egicoccus sp. AB-alg6-2]|uniref:hypothetical protein n=1 Tax=Egicoccus sp. AB-alg6-2 TaxID=3242692 RepID=UPI00359D57FA